MIESKIANGAVTLIDIFADQSLTLSKFSNLDNQVRTRLMGLQNP